MNTSSFCVETDGLSHRFSSGEKVLDAIRLQVPQGSIYGFLGPNGAGKTTTLRLLLGLLKKQEGTISVFGKPFGPHRISILEKTGTLIESPSLYGQLSAVENLRVLRTIYRCPETRIAETLELVGLAHTGKKKAGRFSLGMKQRLSIAVALLHNPALLILDEPTNGLDPNGILEIRELLKKLNRERGTTILVSSHLLAEIEKLVTHVGIIHKGRLIFQGTLGELMNRQQQAAFVHLDTSDNVQALQLLKTAGISSCLENSRLVLDAVSKETVAHLNRRLVEKGIDVYGIATVKNDLESIFMKVIGE